MYLWNLDLTAYRTKMQDLSDPVTNEPYHFSERPLFVELFEHYAALGKAFAEQTTLEAPIVEQTLNLLSIDAKLYYILVEMLVSSDEFTDEEILKEVDLYYKIEYFEIDPGYPFDDYRLIRQI
jgi:hypothetical protein